LTITGIAYYEQHVENLCTTNVEKRLAGGLIMRNVEKLSTFIVEKQAVNSEMWRMWKTYAPSLWISYQGHEICIGAHEMSFPPSYPHRMWITWWKNVQKWQGCTHTKSALS
jgi:hypothetical protein